jgi:recF protein
MNIIDEIEVVNFRCHDKYSLKLNNQTTLITGQNGSGKTSLIEALYISLRGKSFKSTDENIIKKNRDFYRINTLFNDGKKRVVNYKKDIGKKEFIIDDKKTLRIPQKCKYPIVLFEPGNLNLIHSSPSRRRDFLDNLISQIDLSFSKALTRYDKALKQRNNLLKEDYFGPDKMFPWNIIIAKYGSEIIFKRKYYIDQINQFVTNIYKSIADNSDHIDLHYESVLYDESKFMKELEKSFEKDRILGFTSVGPHRDDVIFNFNGKLATTTASRGEIRSIVLALKFIEADIIRNHLNINPVVLLDDIFSELDETRQYHLSTNFKDHQVIITSVSKPVGIINNIQL